MTDEKDPLTYSLVTYAWVLLLSFWGGAVHFFKRIKEQPERIKNYFMEFMGETATSGFCGVITFYGCQAAEIDLLTTAVLVGISGHMGTRMLYLAERAVIARFRDRAGLPPRD